MKTVRMLLDSMIGLVQAVRFHVEAVRVLVLVVAVRVPAPVLLQVGRVLVPAVKVFVEDVAVLP